MGKLWPQTVLPGRFHLICASLKARSKSRRAFLTLSLLSPYVTTRGTLLYLPRCCSKLRGRTLRALLVRLDVCSVPCAVSRVVGAAGTGGRWRNDQWAPLDASLAWAYANFSGRCAWVYRLKTRLRLSGHRFWNIGGIAGISTSIFASENGALAQKKSTLSSGAKKKNNDRAARIKTWLDGTSGRV